MNRIFLFIATARNSPTSMVPGTNSVSGESRLFRWKDISADQMIGATPNRAMIATPGVTNPHPASCSEPRRRRRVTSARRQDLVHLLGRGGQGRLRLALAEQHRHDHGA